MSKRLLALILAALMAFTAMPPAFASGSSEKPAEAAPGQTAPGQAAPEKPAEAPLRTVDSGSCGESVTWAFDTDTGELTISGTGAMAHYNTEDNRPPWFMYSQQIVYAVIGESVTSLGNCAFAYCSALREIFIPASVVSIGDYCFRECTSLTGVGMKEGLQTIGYAAFYSCTALNYVTFPATLTSIGDYAFYESGLVSMWFLGNAPTFNDTVFNYTTILNRYSNTTGWGTTWPWNNCYIYDYDPGYAGSDTTWSYDPATLTLTFSGTGKVNANGLDHSFMPWYGYTHDVTSIVFEEGVTGCDHYDFIWFDNLTSISIPSTMTSWGTLPFLGCTSLENITVDPASTYYTVTDGVLYRLSSGTPERVMFCPASKTGAFTIPSTVQGIHSGAFQSTGLTSITIPANCRYIDDGAFIGNKQLTEFIVDSGNSYYSTADGALLYYGNSVRAYAQGLAGEYTVPANITQIAPYAFYGAQGVTKLSAGPKLTQIGKYAFTGCKTIQSFEVVTPSIIEYCFDGCSNLHTATFLGKKPSFYTNCFRDTASDFKIRYGEAFASSWAPNGETTITLSGFTYPLEVIPLELEPCGDTLGWCYDPLNNLLVFSGTGDMYDYNDTDNLPPWHQYASEILSINFSVGMTGLGAYALYECSNVQTLNLPNTLERIGLHAFRGCSKVYSVSMPSGGSVYKVVNSYLYTADGSTLVYAHAYNAGQPTTSGLTTIGAYAFEGADFTSVTIPSTVTTICEGAYSDCPKLTTVTIPASVTVMGAYAFGHDPKLATVNLTEGLASVGAYAFADDPQLVSITFNPGMNTIGDHAFDGCTAMTEAIFLCDPPANFGTDVFAGCASGFTIKYLRDLVSSWAPNGETVWNGYPIAPYRLPNPTGTQGSYITWEYDYETHILYIDARQSTSIGSFSTSSHPSWWTYKDECVGVEFTSNISSIGKYAFYQFSALQWVHHQPASSSTITIDQYAFAECSSLTEFTSNDRLTKINAYAFKNCTSLTSFFIPKGVSTLETFAFSGCSNLTEINVAYNNTTFSSCDGVVYNAAMTASVMTPPGKTGTLQMPASVTTVNGSSVRSSAISGLILPASVTSLGNGAVMGDPNLTSVLFLGAPPSSVGSNLFNTCNAELTVYYLPENASLWAPAGETTWQGFPIAEWQGSVPDQYGIFCSNLMYSYNAAAHTITITAEPGYTDTSNSQSSFTSYSWYSFREEIEHVVIDASVPCVPEQIFVGWSSLEDFSVDPASEYLASPGGVLYKKDMSLLYAYPMAKTDTEYTVEDGCTAIGKSAFKGNTYLENVTFPATVTNLRYEAFRGCSSLKEAAFLGNPPTLGYDVFTDAWRYFRVAYAAENEAAWAPNGETTWQGYTLVPIGTAPFDPTQCGENVHWSFDEATGELRVFGSGPMYDYDNAENKAPWRYDYTDLITCVTVEDGVTSVCAHAFRECPNLVSVTIGNDVSAIGDHAFRGCSQLASVTLGGAVQSIGSYAFYGACFTSFALPASVTALDGTALGGNDLLAAINVDPANGVYASQSGVLFDKAMNRLLLFPVGKAGEYTVPYGVTEIAESAFREAKNVTKLTLASTVVSIGNYAFYKCAALTELDMSPATIASLPYGMCAYCDQLESVSFPSGLVSTGDHAFYYCSALESVILPNTVETVSEASFCGCSSLTTVHIPASVQTIDKNAFNNCSSITNLTIAEGVVSIGYYAFSSCSSLESVTFPTTVDSFGTAAFSYCSSLHSVTFRGGHPSSFADYVFSNAAEDFCIFYTHAYADEWNPDGTYTFWEGYPIHEELPGPTSGSCGSGVTWRYDYANRILYISGDGAMDDYTSASPAPWYIYAGEITQVVVEDGVTALGQNAFSGCTALWSVELPYGISLIPRGCFSGCVLLSDINIPESVTEIGAEAFLGCLEIFEFDFSSSITVIGDRAFYGSGLTVARFESVPPVYFGTDAFESENAANLHIEANADYMSDWNVGSDLTWHGYTVCFFGGDFCGPQAHWLYDDATRTLYISGSGDMYDFITSSGDNLWPSTSPWFGYAHEIEHVIISYGITYIGAGSFKHCDSFREITIPGSVVGIGFHAFYECCLDSITIEEGLEWISWQAFCAMSVPVIVFPESFLLLPNEGVDCSDVQEVYFLGDCPFQDEADYQPFRGTGCTVYYYASHKESWYAAFDAGLGCNKPCYMVFDPNDNSCGENLFWSFDENTGALTITGYGAMDDYRTNAPWYEHVDEITSVSLPAGITHIGAAAFAGCSGLTSIDLPNGLESIGYAAFAQTGLTEISFPASLTAIGGSAFGETQLTEVTIPGSVGMIENAVFEDCLSLETVVIGEGVTAIGAYAFAWCDSLSSVTLPSTLEAIGCNAFYCCSSLAAIDLPAGLEAIGCEAFGSCYSLESIVIPASVTELGAYAFNYCEALASAVINAQIDEIPERAFCSCYALTSITIPEGITRIGEYAFYCCYGLTRVSLPSTLTEIAEHAFCETGLRRVIIPANCRTFGAGVFSSCSSLGMIIVEGAVITDEENIYNLLEYVDSDAAIGYYPDYASSWAPNGETTWYDHPLVMIENDNEPCGDAMFWSISGSTLTITGSGQMYNYSPVSPAPWAEYKDGITSIVFAEGIDTVGEYAFAGFTRITELFLPDGLEAVFAHAFEGCTALVSVSFPASCTGVDEYAFCSCSELITLTFRDGETGGGGAPISKGLYDYSEFYYVGAYAFYGTGLTRVVLPASVGYIGEHAFGNCEDLVCVTFEGNPPNTNGEIFDGAAEGFHIEYLPENEQAWAPDGETTWEGYPISEQGAVVYWTVTFVDHDGTVLSTQTVVNGEAATAPADPIREGYTFTGWDVDFSNVTGDLTVTAQYEQNAPSQYLKGDVNCDGLVDSADITLAAAYAMSAGSVSEQGIANGDMNGDGLLTAADLSALYGYIQG